MGERHHRVVVVVVVVVSRCVGSGGVAHGRYRSSFDDIIQTPRGQGGDPLGKLPRYHVVHTISVVQLLDFDEGGV